MTLWQRAPREVYRVYGEDEYLSADGDHVSEVPSQPPAGDEPSPPPVGMGSHDSRSGRLLGLGLLVGVTVGAGGLVVANASHPHPAPRSAVAHGALANAARQRPAMVSAKPGPAAHTQASTAPSSRAHASVRPSAPSLSRRRSQPNRAATQPQPTVMSEGIQPTKAELSGSDGEATPIDVEFDFER